MGLRGENHQWIKKQICVICVAYVEARQLYGLGSLFSNLLSLQGLNPDDQTLKSKYFHLLSHPADPSKGNFLTKMTTNTKINAVHIDDVRISQSYCQVGFLKIPTGNQGLPASSPTHSCITMQLIFSLKVR